MIYSKTSQEGPILYKLFQCKIKILIHADILGLFSILCPLFKIWQKKDSHKYDSEWKFASNLPLIYKNKCYSPSVKISMYAHISMHGDTHTSPSRISSLLLEVNTLHWQTFTNQPNAESRKRWRPTLRTSIVCNCKNIINIDKYLLPYYYFFQANFVLKVIFFLKNSKKQGEVFLTIKNPSDENKENTPSNMPEQDHLV